MENPALGSARSDLMKEGGRGFLGQLYLAGAEPLSFWKSFPPVKVTTFARPALPANQPAAQKMDVAKRHGRILAENARWWRRASHFGRSFTGQMTAAGKVPSQSGWS